MRPALVAAEGSGVVLLVAIQHFGAGPYVKAALAGASFIGLLAAPVVVTVVARRAVPLNWALAVLLGIAGLALAVSGMGGGLIPFVVGVLVGVPLIQASVPLVTALWEQNFSARVRGRWFGIVASVGTAAGALSGWLIALWMGDDAGRYRPVMMALAGGVFAGAFAAARIPGLPPARGGRNPLARLSLLWRNPLFGTISVAWMLLGFGNLVTVPLRTEYIASGQYGPALPAGEVLLLTIVVPQAATLLATVLWGSLFDRLDFLWLRLLINGVFILSIFAFFTPSPILRLVGAALFGVAQGGGMIAWNLWVTKYSPPESTADYMAVHTFLTGIRGLLAPFLAYALIEMLPLHNVTWLGVALLVMASVLLVAILDQSRRALR